MARLFATAVVFFAVLPSLASEPGQPRGVSFENHVSVEGATGRVHDSHQLGTATAAAFRTPDRLRIVGGSATRLDLARTCHSSLFIDYVSPPTPAYASDGDTVRIRLTLGTGAINEGMGLTTTATALPTREAPRSATTTTPVQMIPVTGCLAVSTHPTARRATMGTHALREMCPQTGRAVALRSRTVPPVTMGTLVRRTTSAPKGCVAERQMVMAMATRSAVGIATTLIRPSIQARRKQTTIRTISVLGTLATGSPMKSPECAPSWNRTFAGPRRPAQQATRSFDRIYRTSRRAAPLLPSPSHACMIHLHRRLGTLTTLFER